MRKLLAILFAAFVINASAKETVTIYYSWSAADTAANFHRTLADEANKIQDKYTFVFDTKPGAGGSIAANYILNSTNSNLVLANSSAFFIRPNFFPVTESHDIAQFKSIFPACSAPIAISSKKYKSWAEVPTDKPITVGVSGLGVTTHLVATQIAKKYPNMIVVPFKSTTDAVLSVLSDSTDFAVNFIGDSSQYQEGANRVYILGITGDKNINNIKTFSNQGFTKDLELMNSPAQLMVPTTLPDEKFKAWREIFLKAGRTKAVLDSYKPDFCQPNNQLNDKEIQVWYNKQTADWKRLSQGINLK